MTTHAPTPWIWVQEQDSVNRKLVDKTESVVLTANASGAEVYDYWLEVAEKDAAFIARAVNSHEELLKALKGLVNAIQPPLTTSKKDKLEPFFVEPMSRARQAIAKAEGK